MFSVVIPTLNEEVYLPRLLDSIEHQNLQPDEIIVADNHSKDRTREIARKRGCTVVDGGYLSEGRNRGAEAATQDILVFLDADTILPTGKFFSQLIGTFIAQEGDIGSCFATNVKEEDPFPVPSHFFYNSTKRMNTVTAKTLKRVVGELGWCVIARRSFYNKIGGFDENTRVMEDTEFFQRAVQKGGKYIVIPVHIGVSGRRFSKRNLGSTLKLSALVMLMLGGMFFGWKKWRSYMKKYEAEKGALGGTNVKKRKTATN